MWWLVSTAAAMDLSYDDALKRALERNPDLVGAQYDLESAEGQLMGSRGVFDPVLGGHALYEHGNFIDETTLLPYNGDHNEYFATLDQLFATGTQAQLRWSADRYALEGF